jgi:hypothetical protein
VVTAAELRQLRRELERRMRAPRQTVLSHPTRKTKGGKKASRTSRTRSSGLHWNPDPDDVQRSVAQLVLTLVEFLRKLMERQAIRRMEEKTLTPRQVESVGAALMKLEETIRAIGKRFGLTPEDLNLDLGPLKLM